MSDQDARTDATLILAAGGDPDAFRILYQRYADRLHRFFVRRGANQSAAVDLTAETFAQAWASKHRFRDLADGSGGPWLFIIARRVLVASVSRQRLERTMLERLQVEWSETADVVPDASWLEGLDADMTTALDGLPRKQRHALELRVLAGMTYAAIGRELGCTSTAARIRVSRSLAWLRTQLEGSQ
jgi:RNA polymerase sigma factor (sigma-70 family)